MIKKCHLIVWLRELDDRKANEIRAEFCPELIVPTDPRTCRICKGRIQPGVEWTCEGREEE